MEHQHNHTDGFPPHIGFIISLICWIGAMFMDAWKRNQPEIEALITILQMFAFAGGGFAGFISGIKYFEDKEWITIPKRKRKQKK